ncbi:MAG: hypothetical protein FJ137_17715 [Deltaproteobacteria bacterium]|nr:hypothetical protein [Deltaproteobacteria bacterium]
MTPEGGAGWFSGKCPCSSYPLRNNGGFVSGTSPGLGDLRVQTLSNPDIWTAGNVRVVLNAYAYEHRIAFSGAFFYVARDLDGFSGHRITYNSTTDQLPSGATATIFFDAGADSTTAQVAGDRVLFHQIGTGGLILRTR